MDNMIEGRRYKEEPAPINAALEQHYQETIKTLNEKLNFTQDSMRDACMRIERLELRLQEKDAYIEELRSALVEMTVKATMAGGAK